MAPGGGRVKTSHDGDLPGEVKALECVYSLGPCGGRPRGSSLFLRSTGPVHAAPRPHGSPLPPACPLRLYFQTGLFTLPQNHPSKGGALLRPLGPAPAPCLASGPHPGPLSSPPAAPQPQARAPRANSIKINLTKSCSPLRSLLGLPANSPSP